MTDDFRYGELCGFLAAFAYINHKTNHGYSFDLERLPKQNDITQTLHQHFGKKLLSFAIEPVPEGETTLCRSLSHWLFTFADEVRDSEFDFNWNEARGREQIVKEWVNRLLYATQTQKVWRIHVQLDCFYELQWEDFALEAEQEVFLFHLGVSD